MADFSIQSILIAVATGVVVFAVAIRFRGWRLATTLSLVALAAAAIVLRVAGHSPRSRSRHATDRPASLAKHASHMPTEELADGYVSSRECAECHRHQHDTWHASYHRKMTQRATPEAVLGDFGDRHVEIDGAAYDLSRRGDEFWVKVTIPAVGDAPSRTVERPIVMTTGSHHMQVYWLPTGAGRTVAELPIFFLREDDRWISRDASFLKPRDRDPSSPAIGRWNAECIQCHATHGRTRPNAYDADGSSDSVVAEFGIACEACHGPGERHVRSQRGDAVEDHIVNPARLASQRSAQVCGRCHSISILKSRSERADWLEHGFKFRPGEALADSLHVVRLDQKTREIFKASILPSDKHVDRAYDMQFWRDGVVRVVGREFNGLLESACYQKGEMACVSCHVLHKPESDPRPILEWANDQLKVEAQGDAGCTQCHSPGRYASESHTHHLTRSAGSRCYNCHMPHTTYGLLKANRSHTIDIPSVAASVNVGRPNACNLCHLDQTLSWTARHLEEWYAIESPKLDEDQSTISAISLWALRGDAGQRALAAWHMGWDSALEPSGNAWEAPYLAALLDDPYPAVRFIARRSLRRLPAFEGFQYDFIGPNAEREAAVERAFQVWSDSVSASLAEAPGPGKRGPPFSPSVLISPNGTLDRAVFDRLKSERDDTPVSLAE